MAWMMPGKDYAGGISDQVEFDSTPDPDSLLFLASGIKNRRNNFLDRTTL